MEEVENFHVELVLPGPEHVLGNLHGHISQIREHHCRRLSEVLAALRQAPKTAYEIAAEITLDIGAWAGMGPWERRMALLETLAHLERLRVEGRVKGSKGWQFILSSPAVAP